MLRISLNQKNYLAIGSDCDSLKTSKHTNYNNEWRGFSWLHLFAVVYIDLVGTEYNTEIELKDLP